MINSLIVTKQTCSIKWIYTQLKFAVVWLTGLSAILMLIYTKQLKLFNTNSKKYYNIRWETQNILENVQRAILSASGVTYRVNNQNISENVTFSAVPFTSVEDAWPPEKNRNIAHYIHPEVKTALLEPRFKVPLIFLIYRRQRVVLHV